MNDSSSISRQSPTDRMSPEEVAAYFQVKPVTVYRWIKQGSVEAPERTWRGRQEVFVFTREWVEKADIQRREGRSSTSE